MFKDLFEDITAEFENCQSELTAHHAMGAGLTVLLPKHAEARKARRERAEAKTKADPVKLATRKANKARYAREANARKRAANPKPKQSRAKDEKGRFVAMLLAVGTSPGGVS